jgi:hypothetical protein
VADACAGLLGGGSISGVMRDWSRAGLRPPQAPFGPLPEQVWNRTSIRSILLNPRIAGLSAYHGNIVGAGTWEPLVAEETWRAVRSRLEDPARKPPRGVRTLLGGLALCPCENVVTGMPSHTGHHIYRCAPATRNQAWRDGHVARQAAPVEAFIEKLVIARLSRPDAADLVTVPEGGPDVGALREQAAAIRQNLDEMAADRAVGLIDRAQMLAATERANLRLAQIGTALDGAARESVLAPLVVAESVASVWQDLDLSRQRAVIKSLMIVTLHSPGKGARRAFDPDTVKITWQRKDLSVVGHDLRRSSGERGGWPQPDGRPFTSGQRACGLPAQFCRWVVVNLVGTKTTSIIAALHQRPTRTAHKADSVTPASLRQCCRCCGCRHPNQVFAEEL